MNWLTTLYVAILFFVLTPGVLVRLPPKGGKFMVAAVHAVVFALIFHFSQKLIWRMGEGFKEGATCGIPDTRPCTAKEKARDAGNTEGCGALKYCSKINKCRGCHFADMLAGTCNKVDICALTYV
jgi:hypothetical protein